MKSFKSLVSQLHTKSDEQVEQAIIEAAAEQLDEVSSKQDEAATRIDELASKLEEAEKALAEIKAAGPDEESQEVKSARDFMKMQLKSVGGEIIKGGKLVGTKANGDGFGKAGDIVVTEFSKQITERVLKTSSLVEHLGQETGILDYKKKVTKGGTVASWEGEYTSTVPVLVDISSTGGKLTASPMVEKSVAADAFFDAYSFLESDAMKRISAQAGSAILNGDGVKKPLGLVKHFDKVEGLKPLETRAVETFAAVVATVADATLIDVLRNAVNVVPNEYHGNARWAMSNEAFAAVYALKDLNGRSYLQPDPQNAMGYILHGFPVVLDVTLINAPIMFGDFDAGFKVLNVPQSIDVVANQYRIPGFMVYDITYRAAVIMGSNDALVGVYLPSGE